MSTATRVTPTGVKPGLPTSCCPRAVVKKFTRASSPPATSCSLWALAWLRVKKIGMLRRGAPRFLMSPADTQTPMIQRTMEEPQKHIMLVESLRSQKPQQLPASSSPPAVPADALGETQKLLYAYLSEARSKGSMHGGRKLACGALPSKEEPFTDALCHDVIVLSALGVGTEMPWGSKIPLSTVMASATASPAGTFSRASAASPDTRAASSGPPANDVHRSGG
ncbi:MAG: hypothetical protein FRX49_05893 [Trebouxia sp. A1-2]|nr:MAG: hypothetical protein FRX49_05893 [Trebouxia sp. A1-2]